MNQRQGHGHPRLIHARGERRLARLVRPFRRVTGAQIAEKLNAGMTEHTVHRSLLCMALHSRRPVKVSKPDPYRLPKVPTMGMRASELDHGAMEEGGLV